MKGYVRCYSCEHEDPGDRDQDALEPPYGWSYLWPEGKDHNSAVYACPNLDCRTKAAFKLAEEVGCAQIRCLPIEESDNDFFIYKIHGEGEDEVA